MRVVIYAGQATGIVVTWQSKLNQPLTQQVTHGLSPATNFRDTRGQLTGTVPEFNVSSAILHRIIKHVVWLNSLKLTRWLCTISDGNGFQIGDRSTTVVEVMSYKSECRWFDPSWCQWIFHWHNPSDRTMALGSTQPLTEMSTKSISWG